MLNLMKKSAPATTKTAIKMTPAQKKTTTVENVSGKIKNAAFGVATGAGVAGTMMMQNERSIRNRKARAEYHKKVEAVCTVAVGAAVVGAGAAIVQGIFDPVIDVSMLEIEPDAYVELNDKGSEIQEKAAQKSEAAEHVEDEGTVETVEGDDEEETTTPVAPAEKTPTAPADKQPADSAATEGQTPDPKDGQPASAGAPVEKQPAEKVDPAPTDAPADKQPTPAEKTPTAPAEQNHVDPNAEKPADSASAVQTNQGDNGQSKSQTGEQKLKGNNQTGKGNGQNGNNHAKAAK